MFNGLNRYRPTDRQTGREKDKPADKKQLSRKTYGNIYSLNTDLQYKIQTNIKT